MVGGLTLTETRPVFDYIMEAGGHPRRIAPWQELARETLIFGALESIVARIREDRRGADASGFLRQVETDRIERCLVQLEREASGWKTSQPSARSLSPWRWSCWIATICARAGRHASQCSPGGCPPEAAPSMAATAPVGD